MRMGHGLLARPGQGVGQRRCSEPGTSGTTPGEGTEVGSVEVTSIAILGAGCAFLWPVSSNHPKHGPGKPCGSSVEQWPVGCLGGKCKSKTEVLSLHPWAATGDRLFWWWICSLCLFFPPLNTASRWSSYVKTSFCYLGTFFLHLLLWAWFASAPVGCFVFIWLV